MQAVGIIPARYASTRFPGKPLVDIKGKPMIEWVYERAALALKHVYVATDDERIANAVGAFNGNVIMTSPAHTTGTERCGEAYKHIVAEKGKKFDVIVNIQGDEPMLNPGQIREILSGFTHEDVAVATLIRLIKSNEVLYSPNTPKVITDSRGIAIYFSRAPIPYLRNLDQGKWVNAFDYYAHVGMYAYRASVFGELTGLPEGRLERAESLEQLRWLEHGYRIQTVETGYENFSVDTREDLQTVLKYF